MDFQTNWSWLFLCPKARLQSRAGTAGRGSSRPMDRTSSSSKSTDGASNLGEQGWAGVASAALWAPSRSDKQLWLERMLWKHGRRHLGSSIIPSPPVSGCVTPCPVSSFARAPHGVTRPGQRWPRWWPCPGGNALTSNTVLNARTKDKSRHKIIPFLPLFLKLHRKWHLAIH